MKKYIKTYSEFLNEYLSTEGGKLLDYLRYSYNRLKENLPFDYLK